jgi:branched-chain amino acid transport system permease protein
VVAWVAVGVIALFVLNGSYRFGLITSMILAVLSLSLMVLTGYLGQISLAQAAIAGTAGFLLSRLGAWWGGLFPLDIIVASLAAAVVGVIVAIPALRMRGTQLAIVTMAAAVAVEAFIFSNPQFTPRGGNPIVAPSIFGLDLGIRSGTNVARIEFGLLILAILVIVSLALVRILGGDTGRAFLAVRSNEKAAAAIGINVPLTKVLGFGLSAFIAGLGGCLLGYSRGQLSVDSFTVFVGVSLLAFAYLGGITSIAGAIIAGLLGPLGLVYVFLDNAISLGTYYSIVSGLGLVITSVLNPYGIAGAFEILLRKFRLPAQPTVTQHVSAQVVGTKLQKEGSHV